MTGVSLHLTVSAPGGAPGPTPLHVLLRFADGKTLEFDAAKAADLGDYVGPFVHQKCLRQVASGNGDYRDAFLVDFRPDADGERDEVVIEYGTAFKFGPTDTPPATASGVRPAHLFVPPLPVVSKIPGGATAASALYLALTYVGPSGESPACEVVLGLAAGESASVATPPPAGDATGYNVYASHTSGMTLQNAAPLPLGTAWTMPANGVLAAGKALPPNSTRPTATACTATISGGGLAAPVTVNVPMHFFRSRWRWQSAPRPLVRSYGDLVAMKAVFPLDATLVYGARPPGTTVWRGPMDVGPISPAMAGPGDRPDVGPITDWVAVWALTGVAAMEATVRAAAEATGSMPFWVRDAETGALVDTSKRLWVAVNDADHGLHRYGIPDVAGSVVGNYIYLDAAHMPEAAFTAWLLTDDPYFLEGAQATANYGILQSNASRLGTKLPSLTSVTQQRAMAWGWRDIFHLAGFMPEATPGWLLPRSYWHGPVVGDQIKFGQLYLSNKASPCTAVFNLIPITSYTPAFMGEYICMVVAQIKWTGLFPAFDPIAEFAATIRVVMSDPKDADGWDHRVQEPYYQPTYDARKGAAAGGANRYYEVQASPDTPVSWAELLQWYKVWAPSNLTEKQGYTDPSTWPKDGLSNPGSYYLPTIRAALAALALAGIDSGRAQGTAKAGHDWLKAQIDKQAAAHILHGPAWKWAIPPA